jgi:Domain of unknown function (DUF4326)
MSGASTKNLAAIAQKNAAAKSAPAAAAMHAIADTPLASRIRLGNKRSGGAAKPQPGETIIDIDRTNPVLGNPYILKDHRDDARRAQVIALFDEKYQRDIARQGPMAVATEELAEQVRKGGRLILMCWCAGAPFNKPCHGDLIIGQIRHLLAFTCE